MIRVRILGESLIEVGEIRVRPDAKLLFAVLLYLGAERGRRAERDALCAMLWPRADVTRRKHNLRQILYKLNRMGVNTGGGSGPLALRTQDVWLDFEDAVAEEAAGESDVLHSAGGKALPGYAPRFSAAFRAWLDELRARAESSARRRIVAALSRARREAEWERVERLARACLQIDPLNEEATLALAEATALAGSKAKAIAMLDAYAAELGDGASDARLPAQVLRRRIAEKLPKRGRGIIEGPLVGRDEVMRELAALVEQTKGGRASAHLVYGPQGIGKTRVVYEMSRSATLCGAVIVSQRAAPDDAQTPGLTLTRMFRVMLTQPGSLGLAPDVLTFLRRVTAQSPSPGSGGPGDIDSSEDALVRAMVNLQRALAWERTLVLTLDDVHFADALSRRILNRAQGCLTDERVLLVLTGINETGALNSFTTRRQLRRLDPEASLRLSQALLDQLGEQVSAHQASALAVASGGHPFVLREAILATRGRGGPTSLDSIEGILQHRCDELSDAAREILLTALILGEHATVAMLLSGTTLSGVESERALVELEDVQILSCESGGSVHAHSLWMNSLERLFPAGQIAARRLRVAQLLDAASRDRPDAAELLLSSAAQFQRAGDSGRASTTLARSGAVLKDRALGSAAHSAYSRSFRMASSSDDIDRLVFQAIVAASGAEQTKDLRLLLDHFASRLAESRALTLANRTLLRLLETEFRQRVGFLDRSLTTTCESLIQSQELTPYERLRAALIGIRAAEFAGDEDAVRRIGELVKSTRGASVAEQQLLGQISIVHALAQKRIAEACHHAMSGLPSSLSQTDGAGLHPSALLNARIPFWFNCDFYQVGVLINAAHTALGPYSATLAAVRVEDILAGHCIDMMRLDDARKHTTAALALAREFGHDTQVGVVGQTVLRLRVAERDPMAESELAGMITRNPAEPPFSRLQTFALSNVTVQHARAGNHDALKPVLTELTKHCEHLKRLCPFDYPFAAQAIGISCASGPEEGSVRWQTYRHSVRVAVNAPSPFVAALLGEFAIRA